MTFTKNIARKHAEAARRNALDIEKALAQETESFRVLPLEAERRECVAIWNAFCAEETERLAKKDARNRSFGEILPGVWVASR